MLNLHATFHHRDPPELPITYHTGTVSVLAVDYNGYHRHQSAATTAALNAERQSLTKGSHRF